MNITHEIKNGILVIKPISQRLDAKDAPKFKDDVTNLVKSTEIYNAIFDLSSINFIDSSGVGTLLATLRILNPTGGELKLTGVQPSVLNVFQLVSIDKIFKIYKTTDEAVSSFEKQSYNSEEDTTQNSRTPQ